MDLVHSASLLALALLARVKATSTAVTAIKLAVTEIESTARKIA
jgi:hypothetical protein